MFEKKKRTCYRLWVQVCEAPVASFDMLFSSLAFLDALVPLCSYFQHLLRASRKIVTRLNLLGYYLRHLFTSYLQIH